MRAIDDKEFARLMEGLCRAFNREPDRAMLEAYWLGMQDVPIEAVRLSVVRALREQKYMPVPMELRALAGEMSGAERAIVAWRVVIDTLPTDGPYHTFRFDDDATQAAVAAIGGWARLCGMSFDELERYERKRFVEAYVTFFRTGPPDHMAAPYVGLFDRANGTTTEPKVIGVGLSQRALVAPDKQKLFGATP